MREHALGFCAAVHRKARLGIERVGDHVAARPGRGTADHQHPFDAVRGRVVVGTQLPVAHGCFAVVDGELGHLADLDRRVLLRIGLNLEDPHVVGHARAGGVGGIAAAPVQTVAGNAETRRSPPCRKAVEVAAAPLARGGVPCRRRRGHPMQPFEVAEQPQLLRGHERPRVRVLRRRGRVQIALRIHAAARQLVERDVEGRERWRRTVLTPDVTREC